MTFDGVFMPARFRDLVAVLYEVLRITEPVEVPEERGPPCRRPGNEIAR